MKITVVTCLLAEWNMEIDHGCPLSCYEAKVRKYNETVTECEEHFFDGEWFICASILVNVYSLTSSKR